GAGTHIWDVSGEPPCAPFHKPFPRKRPVVPRVGQARCWQRGPLGSSFMTTLRSRGVRRSAGTTTPLDVLRNRFRPPGGAAVAGDLAAIDRGEGRRGAFSGASTPPGEPFDRCGLRPWPDRPEPGRPLIWLASRAVTSAIRAARRSGRRFVASMYRK